MIKATWKKAGMRKAAVKLIMSKCTVRIAGNWDQLRVISDCGL